MTAATAIDRTSARKLKGFVERLENLQADRADITEDIRLVYAEAKAEGFDTPVLRQVLKLRRLDPAEASERQQLVDLYCRALEEGN